MKLDEFKSRIDTANDESEVDGLCWQWLMQAAECNGFEGKTAVQIMKIIQERLMP